MEDNDGMGNIVGEYYKKLFAKSDLVVDTEREVSPRRITEAQNEILIREVTFDEFTTVVNQMHPDKASGPDGLNPAFCQNFWDIMGKDVFDCCKKWLKGDSFPADLNSTNVILIPKNENAATMRDFRPIALCMCCIRSWKRFLLIVLKRCYRGA